MEGADGWRERRVERGQVVLMRRKGCEERETKGKEKEEMRGGRGRSRSMR